MTDGQNGQADAVVAAPDRRIVEALDAALAAGELGVQVAAYLDGELIVDAAAGLADAVTGQAANTDTLFASFSVTKGVVAIAVHLQAERGLLEYDRPIADYWPAFGARGKQVITVRQLLGHQAGVPWMPDGVTPRRQADWSWMVRAIERMEPATDPGVNCYHALVWGWIAGELVRRTDPHGRAFEVFLREELLIPLGVEDLYLGVPPSEDARVARLEGGGPPDRLPSPGFLRGMPLAVYPRAEVYNDERVRRTVNPGAGAVSTARAMARCYALLAGRGAIGGVRLLSAERVDAFVALRDGGERPDAYLGAPSPMGVAGLWVGGDRAGANPVVGPDPRVLYFPGAGGALAWAELDNGLAVAICHNRMFAAPDPHPFLPIAAAVRAVARDHTRTS